MNGKLFSFLIVGALFSFWAVPPANSTLSTEKVNALFEARAITISDGELAYHWAPVIYQDTDSTDYSGDYLTRFDYDRDWDGCNNWENKNSFPLESWVYYWVSETSTNWFIGYAFFHPRDWCEVNSDFFSHENDLEGCLLVIRKDDSTFGKFLLMITIAHSDFYSFKDFDQNPSKNVRDENEDLDGDVDFQGTHPKIYIQAKGHGIVGDPAKTLPDEPVGVWQFNPSGDYIIYHPNGIAGVPGGGNDRNAGYALRPIDELWDRRTDSQVFASWGTFRGDTFGDNKANAPWGWDDWNDGEILRGEFFTDPAHMVDYYHDGLGDFQRAYVYKSWM